MRISHTHRFVFLAYPRAASSSIRRLLDPYSDLAGVRRSETTAENPFHHHMNAREAHRAFTALGWDWEAYSRFCVVRNPYARLVSLFRRRTEVELGSSRLPPISGALSALFAALPLRAGFLLYVLTRLPGRGVAQDLPAFTEDGRGRPLVSDVLRFEALEMDLPPLLGRLGIDLDQGALPRLNASAPGPAISAYYLPLTRRLVRRKYRPTIERFGYGPPP